MSKPTTSKRPALMADVAKLAGVSHQTVSRVVNQSVHVRQETRDRVLAAMEVLDYRPNRVARSLATGRSKTLGLACFGTAHYGPASTMLGIERAAHDAGYFVSVVSLLNLDGPSLLSAVERLRGQGVDGILIIAPQQAAAQSLARLPTDVPIVFAEAGPQNSRPIAAVDHVAGAAAATRHLLALGHKTVWHVAGPSDWLEAELRVQGWLATLKAAGAPVPMPLRGDWSPHGGYEAGVHLLDMDKVTAVFVANDSMALGLLRAMNEAGRQVPSELSVVGFDDIPEAPFFTPPLTTVRQDFAEMGRRSLGLLLEELESGVRSSRSETIVPKLIMRESTGRPETPVTP